MRPRKSEHEKRRNRAARQARYRATLVQIGNSEMSRWKFIKEQTALVSDQDVAKLLMDSFTRHALANAESDQGLQETADEKLSPHSYRLSKAGTSSHYRNTAEVSGDDSDRLSEQPLEPEDMEMDCDTVFENTVSERQSDFSPRVVRSRPVEKKSPSDQVEFLSIHGLPVNVPFTLQYTSPILGSMLESKLYVIVEQEMLSYRPLTSVTITVQGDVFENTSDQGMSAFMTDIDEQKISSWVNIMNVVGKEKENVNRTEETLDEPADQYDPDLLIKQEIVEDEHELDTASGTDQGAIVTNIHHNMISHAGKGIDVQEDCLPQTSEDAVIAKRKSEDNSLHVFEKKEKYEKLEDTSCKSERHSSRLQGRGYRIDYEKFNELDYLGDFSDLDDEMSDGDDESDWNQKSLQKAKKKGRPKKIKDTKDPNFNLEENLLEKEEKDGNKLNEKKETKPRKQRIIVKLSEHTDKYTVEEHVSYEMKDRSKESAEKTVQMFACSQCNRFRTESEEQMEKHLEHHLNGELSCKKCDFVTSNWREMHTHRQVEHMKETRSKHCCPICALKCGGQLQYKHHLSAVHNLSPLLCKVCLTSGNQVAFENQENYRAHYLQNHLDHMFHCESCGCHYISKISLKQHLCAGRPSESFKVPCDICGKEMRKDSISLHKINVHYNMRRHPCPHCNYAAKQSMELKEHILARHEGVHPYKCDQCEFTCVRSSQLVSHQRTHSGHKPYKCDECPYAASWNVQLKDHKKLHGNAIAIACEQCGVVVRRGPGYTKHMKKEHGEIPASDSEHINTGV